MPVDGLSRRLPLCLVSIVLLLLAGAMLLYVHLRLDGVSADGCGEGPFTGSHLDLEEYHCSGSLHESRQVHTRVVAPPVYGEFGMLDTTFAFDVRGVPTLTPVAPTPTPTPVPLSVAGPVVTAAPQFFPARVGDSPVITGPYRVGDRLTVDTSPLEAAHSDGGTLDFSYSWRSNSASSPASFCEGGDSSPSCLPTQGGGKVSVGVGLRVVAESELRSDSKVVEDPSAPGSAVYGDCPMDGYASIFTTVDPPDSGRESPLLDGAWCSSTNNGPLDRYVVYSDADGLAVYYDLPFQGTRVYQFSLFVRDTKTGAESLLDGGNPFTGDHRYFHSVSHDSNNPDLLAPGNVVFVRVTLGYDLGYDTFDTALATTAQPLASRLAGGLPDPLPPSVSGSRVQVSPVPGFYTPGFLGVSEPSDAGPSTPNVGLYVHVANGLPYAVISGGYAELPVSALLRSGPLSVSFRPVVFPGGADFWYPESGPGWLFRGTKNPLSDTDDGLVVLDETSAAEASAVSFSADFTIRDFIRVCLPVPGDLASQVELAGGDGTSPTLLYYERSRWNSLSSSRTSGPGGPVCGDVGNNLPVVIGFPLPRPSEPEVPPVPFNVRLDLGFAASHRTPPADLEILRRSWDPFGLRAPPSGGSTTVAAPNLCYVFFSGGFLDNQVSDSGWYRSVTNDRCDPNHDDYDPLPRGRDYNSQAGADQLFHCLPSPSEDGEICHISFTGRFYPSPSPEQSGIGTGGLGDPASPRPLGTGFSCPLAKSVRTGSSVPSASGPVLSLPAQDRLLVTVQPCAGLRAPSLSLGHPDFSPHSWQVRGRVSQGDGPLVHLPTVNALHVVSPSSTARGGSPVELRLHFEAQLGRSGELRLDFSGLPGFGQPVTGDLDPSFMLPDSFSSDDVFLETFLPPGHAPSVNPVSHSFPSSSVSVSEDRRYVTVRLPPGFGEDSGAYTHAWHTLVLRRGLSDGEDRRVHNSGKGGVRSIVLQYTDGGIARERTYRSYVHPADPVMSFAPAHGQRGSAFEISGQGFPEGPVAVRPADPLRPSACVRLPNAEVLADGVADRYGFFRLPVNPGGRPGSGDFRFVVEDARDRVYCGSFAIDPVVKVTPHSVNVGGQFTLQPLDLELGAVMLHDPSSGSRVLADCLGTLSLRSPSDGRWTFNVPSGAIPGPGYVEVYSRSQLSDVPGSCIPMSGTPPMPSVRYAARVEIEILPIALTIEPDTVVAGQTVRISGSGFSQSPTGVPDVALLEFGRYAVDVPASDASVDSLGYFDLTVDVPAFVSAHHGSDMRVRVTSHAGALAEGTVSIASPELSIDPDTGRLGSMFAASYSGFPARSLVQFEYGPGCGVPGSVSGSYSFAGTGLTGPSGSGSAELTLPIAFPEGAVPTAMRVYGSSVADGAEGFCAEVDHSVPVPVVGIFPLVAVPGSVVTLTAENLPPSTSVSSVHVGGVEATLLSSKVIGHDGSLELRARVPGVDPGRHPVRMTYEDGFVAWTLTVVRPGPRGSPDEVFEDLGGLLSVWRYEEDSDRWLIWSPLFVGSDGVNRSTLTLLSGGEGVWVFTSSGGVYFGVSYGPGVHLIYVL